MTRWRDIETQRETVSTYSASETGIESQQQQRQQQHYKMTTRKFAQWPLCV